MPFLENLERLCVERGESMNGVAKAIGSYSGAVTKWKTGSLPRNSTLRKIADHFGVTVDWLMSNDPMPTVWDSTQESSAYMPLSAAEKQIIDMYRAVDEMGRMRIAQAILAVYDKEMSK